MHSITGQGIGRILKSTCGGSPPAEVLVIPALLLPIWARSSKMNSGHRQRYRKCRSRYGVRRMPRTCTPN